MLETGRGSKRKETVSPFVFFVLRYCVENKIQPLHYCFTVYLSTTLVG